MSYICNPVGSGRFIVAWALPGRLRKEVFSDACWINVLLSSSVGSDTFTTAYIFTGQVEKVVGAFWMFAR